MFIVVELKKICSWCNKVNASLSRIRSIANYQFGLDVGEKLFPDDVEIEYSRATGRIRYINLRGKRLVTLRPTDGMLCLSIGAAQFMKKELASYLNCFVTVRQDVAKYIAEGGDVFAVHVVKAGNEIHAKEEVIALDEAAKVLAVGRALLSSAEMKAFKTGVAVKIRHGCGSES
jgi:predicted RNA-binding protein (TIGR00451 family)